MNKLLLFLLCALILIGCKDEPKQDLGLADDATFMFGPSGWSDYMEMRGAPKDHSPDVSVHMLITPDEKWLSAFCDYKFGCWRINVSVQDNPNYFRRLGTVTVKSGKASAIVYVVQGPNETATFMTQPQVLRNTSGEFTVKFKTEGDPNLVMRMTDPWNNPSGPGPWISLGEVKEVDSNTYEVPVNYNANDGFGRIAQLVVSTRHSQSGLRIIQLPKEFEESETMVTDHFGGSMALMLGCIPGSMDYDMRNIGRIKRLKIEGGIGMYDLNVLRMLTKSSNRPIGLNLADAWFVSSSRPANPYESFGYTPPKPEQNDVILADNYMPYRLFAWSHGLDGIVLPTRTLAIEGYVFDNAPIKCIDIPATVRSIGNSAFNNCKNLTVININKSSQLETLGEASFATNSKEKLEALYFPATLKDVSENVLRLTKVKRLYLDMEEPPAWVLKTAVIDTLFLPDAKLIGVYRAADGWGTIPEIRVWPEGWKETPWP